MRKAIVAVVIVFVVGAAAAIVATKRPELNTARNKTVTTWEGLLPQLNPRYANLSRLVASLDSALVNSGENNQSIGQLKTSLAAWGEVSKANDAVKMVRVANLIEEQVAQLRSLLGASARLSGAAGVAAAATTFDTPRPVLVVSTAIYNASVRSYEKKRTSALARPVAQLFGFDAIPTFEPSLPPGQG